MKLRTCLPLLLALHATTVWAETPPPIELVSPNTDPSAQPGDLSRLEFRATSMLFIGTAIGLAGIEAGWVSAEGYTAEIQMFSLLNLSGSGYQVTARVGRRFYGMGTDLVRDESRFYTGWTPLVGVRYGDFPYAGTTDGYQYKSTDLGLQGGIAFDWGYGAMSGFASRVEALVTLNVYSDPNFGGDWTYATGMNPAVTFDIGILFGGYASLE